MYKVVAYPGQKEFSNQQSLAPAMAILKKNIQLMEDQFNPIVVENSLNDKKVWQTPVIEIINRDNVKSGSIPAVEGQFTIHGSIGSS